MKLVTPESIKTSRVYLTIFDRITYSQVGWTNGDVENIKRDMERQLKLLALLKGHIVIAASHLLESELAHEILLPHPRLFSEGIIVPALRSEFKGFVEFLNSKVEEGREADQYIGDIRLEMANMLDSEVATAVHWQVMETSGWFKTRLINDLEDENSLLQSCLRTSEIKSPPDIISQIDLIPQLSRQDVYALTKKLQDKHLQYFLNNYADFVYYLSGAKAVHSEGVLPQENLLDFSLSDMVNGKTRLSESEIFFKLFIDQIKNITQSHFPVDMLDALSIEDVMDLHHLAVQNRFVEKYNVIQELTKDGLKIHDPERLVLLMRELEDYEIQLYSDYHSAIEKELPRFLQNIKHLKKAKLLNAVASFIITPWSMVSGAKDIVVSGLEVSGKKQIEKAVKNRAEKTFRACNRLLDRSELDSKPIFLEFIQSIEKKYISKMLDM